MSAVTPSASAPWSVERARSWAEGLPTLAGCNYVPASALNPVEMWSAGTWDPERIDRELAAAAELGFNAMRVYLHDAVWRAEGEDFLDRIDAFLSIADRHGMVTLLVFFDDCWHEPDPLPERVPGIHNSGWTRSPGRARLLDRSGWGELETYVRAVVRRFREDARVLGWDLYNEIGNIAMPLGLSNANREAILVHMEKELPQRHAALDLARLCAEWVRGEAPSQPLTIGVYQESDKMGIDDQVLPLCDVVSFHHYGDTDDLRRTIARLSATGRPLMCTEYLNRLEGCTFETHLARFVELGIPAFNWGLVDGRTQTKFSWTDRPAADGTVGEPDPWFHDILRADLSPYDPDEAKHLREMLT